MEDKDTQDKFEDRDNSDQENDFSFDDQEQQSTSDSREEDPFDSLENENKEESESNDAEEEQTDYSDSAYEFNNEKTDSEDKEPTKVGKSVGILGILVLLVGLVIWGISSLLNSDDFRNLFEKATSRKTSNFKQQTKNIEKNKFQQPSFTNKQIIGEYCLDNEASEYKEAEIKILEQRLQRTENLDRKEAIKSKLKQKNKELDQVLLGAKFCSENEALKYTTISIKKLNQELEKKEKIIESYLSGDKVASTKEISNLLDTLNKLSQAEKIVSSFAESYMEDPTFLDLNSDFCKAEDHSKYLGDLLKEISDRIELATGDLEFIKNGGNVRVEETKKLKPDSRVSLVKKKKHKNFYQVKKRPVYKKQEKQTRKSIEKSTSNNRQKKESSIQEEKRRNLDNLERNETKQIEGIEETREKLNSKIYKRTCSPGQNKDLTKKGEEPVIISGVPPSEKNRGIIIYQNKKYQNISNRSNFNSTPIKRKCTPLEKFREY